MKKLIMVRTYRQKDNPTGELETQETDFYYDETGRLTKTVFPDLSEELSTYEIGQLKDYTTRRGQKKMIDVYDKRGREIHHFWRTPQNSIDPATPAIERRWDDANRMTKIWNNFSTVEYSYDEAGQVRTESTTVTGDAGPKVVRYCRYPNGEVSQITYPNGTPVNRFYTARGQLESVGWGAGATSYVYLRDGKVDFQARTGGEITNYRYDGRGLISSVRHSQGGTIWPTGNIGGTTGTGFWGGSVAPIIRAAAWRSGPETVTITMTRGSSITLPIGWQTRRVRPARRSEQTASSMTGWATGWDRITWRVAGR